MSAGLLHEAAELMRERAEAANHTGRSGWAGGWKNVIATTHMPHVKSWHPVVALAVADWLELAARRAVTADVYQPWWDDQQAAVAIARAYLGRAS